MSTYEVSVQSTGGCGSRKIRVQALNPTDARRTACMIAAADAKANGKPYTFIATSDHIVS